MIIQSKFVCTSDNQKNLKEKKNKLKKYLNVLSIFAFKYVQAHKSIAKM